MKLRDTNILDRDKQEVELDNLRFDAAGKFWYDDQNHEVGPAQMLDYAMRLEGQNSKLEAMVKIMRIAIDDIRWATTLPPAALNDDEGFYRRELQRCIGDAARAHEAVKKLDTESEEA